MLTRVLAAVAAVLLACAASACTAESAGPRAAAPASEPVTSSDAGDGRPPVSFDGPMVRRRVALLMTGEGQDVATARAVLERAAHDLGMDLTDVPGTVLDAHDLDGSSPELTLLLPEGRTIADGRALVGGSSSAGGSAPVSVRFATVLVHDLMFALPTASPAAVARSIEDEGILSDALGAYSVEPEDGELCIDYTGPLLSDRSIAAVRVGIARAADADPRAVGVFPRTLTGEGVRLGEETGARSDRSAAAPRTSSAHGGHVTDVAADVTAGAAADAGEAAEGAPAAPFSLVAGGLALGWAALLVVLARRRVAAPGDAPRAKGVRRTE